MKDFNENWIDENLRYLISNELEVEPSEITKHILSKIENLNLSDNNISNLKGIEYAINLESLNLCKNNIREAHLLKDLVKLNILELSENRIEDTSFLKDLENLKSVGLDSNNISNIGDLSNLRHLQVLNISNNQIQDLTFLNSIPSDNIKILASDQYIILNPITVDKGQDYTFKSPIQFNEDTIVLLDNVQVKGTYNLIVTDKRPSILYSISKVLVKNVLSNCIIKADFYHEVPFSKSTILSGTIIQQINLKLKNVLSVFEANNIVKLNSFCRICGNLYIESKSNSIKNIPLKDKVITVIDSSGNKIQSITDGDGFYEFCDLKKGRYTLLFPFLNDYDYITPSLVVCNLKNKEELKVDCKAYKK